LKFGTKSN